MTTDQLTPSGRTVVAAPRVEHHREPMGIGQPRPRLSWVVEQAAPGWVQDGYELRLEQRGVVQVAAVTSAESVLVPWPFPPLASRERAEVGVRVRGADGVWSTWSAPTGLEVGLLGPADWSARFVGPSDQGDPEVAQPAPMLRKELELAAPVASARLYVTALGLVEVELNGRPVGQDVLAPGWTVYDQRLRVTTYDVTDQLDVGPNALGLTLGEGWFRGRVGFPVPSGESLRAHYGTDIAALVQLEVTHTDGTTTRVGTDGTWRWAHGPIRESSLYDGEHYDARDLLPGWSRPGFDDAGWAFVEPVVWDLGVLVGPDGPPVRRTQVLPVRDVLRTPSGATVLDFGQNLVGRLRLTVDGPAGTVVTLRHAEVLEHGELGVRPLRTARATDTYVLRGGGTEVYEPHFTIHGFRYAEVTGWPGELSPGDVEAVVCHSDLERTGWFACSDELVTRLHENVVWGMRGNFVDVPTDCPQRDERLGWTGDLQVFSPTATYLYDCTGFLTSWLADLVVEQQRMDGVVPIVVPQVIPQSFAWTNLAQAAWGDAGVVVPWVVAERSGDEGLLARQLGSMTDWLGAIEVRLDERSLWRQDFELGDWLDPSAPPDHPEQAQTPPEVVATAYAVRSADLVVQAATRLGRTDVVARWQPFAERVRTAFRSAYLTGPGQVLGDSVTGYALALELDLLPDAGSRRYAGDRLAELVTDGGFRIATGFVGTPLVCDALTHAGHLDVAYRLLLQTQCPSWLYPVTMGATTVWERWDSMLPDGTINPGGMTSFNHYALGAVADWLHRTVAGLAPAAPGYRRLVVEPRPGGGLTWATTRHLTPYGTAEVRWGIDGDELLVTATVPVGVTAVVRLPGTAEIEVGHGRHRWTVAAPVEEPRTVPA